MFSIHMGEHMVLSMLAPILLVLGGPVTLALRALPTAGRTSPPGPREWLLAFVDSPLARVLTNPLVALALFVGRYYGLYFSGLFDVALPHHWAHLAMNAHFVLIGLLFYWPVIGIDPAPTPAASAGRLGLLFASIPFHAFFGIVLMGSQTVIGENFYRSLALPWVTNRCATSASAAGSRGRRGRSRCWSSWSCCWSSGRGPTSGPPAGSTAGPTRTGTRISPPTTRCCNASRRSRRRMRPGR